METYLLERCNKCIKYLNVARSVQNNAPEIVSSHGMGLPFKCQKRIKRIHSSFFVVNPILSDLALLCVLCVCYKILS